MANKTLWISGSALIFTALLLSVIVSISLPFIRGLDIIRINTETLAGRRTDIRMGVWANCFYEVGVDFCGPTGLGYEVGIFAIAPIFVPQTITATWTRHFVIHPIATVFIFVAFLATLFTRSTLSTRSTIDLVAFAATLFATLMELIAFIIDIAVFAHTHSIVKIVDENVNGILVTVTSAGFWLTFVSLVLLVGASVTLFIGRRRDRKSSEGASYPMQPKTWTDKFHFA
ncbi:pali-domain-containing protein [Pholiota conissans]|uniref:Pali-domain-containing protein n=1 Tax=Pholiota conissans TaxID=109636 RepID=A0A9P5Z2I2_9AGAR|nr:pali-domain-containing protein [Pholiota conissans]